MKKTIDIDAFGKEWTLSIRVADKRDQEHVGIGNRCKDGLYVLFIDYDGKTPLEWIETEILILQDDFRLTDAFIFKTKRGHHVIFLDKLSIVNVIDALDMTTCDKEHMHIPLYYGRKEWVLRQTEKENEHIKYLGVRRTPLDYKSKFIERSNAHALFLENIGVPKEDLRRDDCKYDAETSITLAHYYVSKKNN